MNADGTAPDRPIDFPLGFQALVGNIGIKDEFDDVLVLVAESRVPVAAVFTRSRFAGPAVEVSRHHAGDGMARAWVAVARNANVATGPEGLANATELTELTAALIGATSDDVLVSSTGVIGRLLPMPRIRSWFEAARMPTGGQDEHGVDKQGVDKQGVDATAAARAIMTTDTHPKIAQVELVGGARVVGIAKGVGMIEPDMATMLTAVTTDAEVDPDDLDALWRRVVATTFNAVSVDTDTSTSDTALLFASGHAGEVDLVELESAVRAVALSLTRQIAADGEGAETLIEVLVDGARDDAQAKRVAKAIVNSPLVKTAVHGADPNWGRVAMAVGKCSDDTDIDQRGVVIRFGSDEVYPRLLDDAELAGLSAYMARDEVLIHVSLGIADGAFTVYGCDLTDGYVRINADYTT